MPEKPCGIREKWHFGKINNDTKICRYFYPVFNSDIKSGRYLALT